MAFEISEAGIAAARIGARAELDFLALKPGMLCVSPLKENVLDPDEFVMAVRSLAGTQANRKRRDVALILPDFSARIAVLDFDSLPHRPQGAGLADPLPPEAQRALRRGIRRPELLGAAGEKGKTDVVVVVAPLEIVSRYEAPFRAAGMNPGLVTTSSLAALELAPEAGLSVLAKLTGTRAHRAWCATRSRSNWCAAWNCPPPIWRISPPCWCPLSSTSKTTSGAAPKSCCSAASAPLPRKRSAAFAEELGVEVEPLRSPLGAPGENNAGLLGYLRSIARNN